MFANSRRLAERLTARLNEIAAERAELELPDAGSPAQMMAQIGASLGARRPLIARAHHGSVSKEQRALIEADLKSGRLPCVVATSSLELGIDMGAVDLVVQVEAPPSVASGLQRVGRAGHQVGAVSRGVLFPKFRGDLVDTAVVVQRMRDGLIESLHIPANPLDVLAQQIVVDRRSGHHGRRRAVRLGTTLCALRDVAAIGVRRGARHVVGSLPVGRVRRAAAADRVGPGQRRDLRTTGRAAARGDERRHDPRSRAVRGLPGRRVDNHRVGELDEEMVYESRVGDVFSARRVELADRGHHPRPGAGLPRARPTGALAVLEGRCGRAVRPSWVRRPARSSGRWRRCPPSEAVERARDAGLDEFAANNLVSYLAEQREATA